ncbi:MAG: GNAT family N-acetyltransferase [Rickettsiaceae bacterium]|nr:GNAT family N-acetyltransferase [Rickettsiaceae bacterium]
MINFLPKPIDKIIDTNILEELRTFPNQSTIEAILANSNKHQIWQLPSNKSYMLIENCPGNEPFIFLAGILNAEDVEAVIKLCPNGGFPMVYCPPIYHHLFIARNWDFNLRVQLTYKGLPLQENQEECDIRAIDNQELAKQSLWWQKMLDSYNSAEDFFTSEKAYVLVQDNKVISEGYIGYHGGKYGEISVITNPDYRNQEAGQKIATYVAAKCQEMGIKPVWSCHVHNKASLKTGIKAGFQIEKYYVQLVPEFGNLYSSKLEEWLKNNPPKTRNW